MRSKKVLINTFAGILNELVTIICGFIVPRLILSSFGSQYNGITSSVTQFLGCISLFKSSIAGVTKAALYKPLAEDNMDRISSILKATENFLRKVVMIYAAAVVVFAAVYPFMISTDFDWLFTFTLVLILGINTFVQFFFGLTYQYLLQADQKQGVLAVIHVVSTVANTCVAALLIRLGCTIHMVKLGSAMAFSLIPLLINLYVCKNYRINRKAKADNIAINQRWDAFGHAMATFVHNNTDIVVLTMFSTLLEISVYTVYALVCNGLKTLFKTLTNSIGAVLGNMLAKNEMDKLKQSIDLFEYICVLGGTSLFSVAGIMMIPFVSVYTRGISDTNYIRPVFSFLIVLSTALFCFRIPYQTMVEVAGHYKQTKSASYIEAIGNIVISIAFVKWFGLIGVMVGTLFATLFRTVMYVLYLRNHIINRNLLLFIKQILLSIAICSCSALISFRMGLVRAAGYLDFFINTGICMVVCGAVTIIISLFFCREQFFGVLHIFRRMIEGRRAGKKLGGLK